MYLPPKRRRVGDAAWPLAACGGVRYLSGNVACGPSRAHPPPTYVPEGDFVEDGHSLGPGSFFAGKTGVPHGPHATAGGCVVLTAFSATPDFVPV